MNKCIHCQKEVPTICNSCNKVIEKLQKDNDDLRVENRTLKLIIEERNRVDNRLSKHLDSLGF